MGAQVDVLASCDAFCAVVGQATRWDVRGAWAGSAFRSHPHGLIVDGIKFTDDHHVDRTCSIAITDGPGWSRDYCKNPTANGNPHPQPVDGVSIVVWRNGRWIKEEYRLALEQKVRAILNDAEAQIATGKTLHEALQARQRQEREAGFRSAEAAALARVKGVRS